MYTSTLPRGYGALARLARIAASLMIAAMALSA